jgi:hypothetical protein
VPKLPLKKRVKAAFKSRRFRHGSLAALLIVLFIAAMVILNVIASLLVKRVPALSPDLSPNSLYTLGEESFKVLEAIPENYEIELEIFATELACAKPDPSIIADDYGVIPQAHEMLKRYPQYSNKVKIVYTDLSKAPNAAAKYGDGYANQIKNYYVAIASYKTDSHGATALAHVKISSFYDMLPVLADDSYLLTAEEQVVQSLVETTITSAIKTVCQTYIPKVAILTGNDNRDSGNIKSSLNSNGFDIMAEDINLLTQGIPSEVDIAVMAAPMRDLSISELDKLDAFLANDDKLGKSLVLFANAAMPDMPALNSLLEDWSLGLTRDVVYETERTWVTEQYNYIFFNAAYKYEPFAKDLGDRSHYVIMDRPLEIKLLDAGKSKAVLATTTGGVAFSNKLAANLSSVTAADKAERITAALSARTVYDEEKNESSSNILLLGTDSVYASLYFGSEAYANQEFMLNAFNELAGISEKQIYIQPKSLISKDFEASEAQADAIRIIFQYALPVLLVLAGAYIYLRRRYL